VAIDGVVDAGDEVVWRRYVLLPRLSDANRRAQQKVGREEIVFRPTLADALSDFRNC
jgi:hypothetical protein